ncbi:MAG TPA: FKBP-type peptidyl-prolyl cis-trans isomerase [Acidimicrobiales bacterium]|nr:FKBP-type peptidyl-prolyl cis-trans isomerase [Acidimicrobiales bacterium]
MKISALVAVATVAMAAAACGSSTSPPAGQAGSATTAPTTTTTSAAIAPVSTPTAAGTFGTRPPAVTVPTGPPPTVLESSDLITGTGAAAAKGDTITVQYVLVSYATDSVIQSSWDSQPFSFPLGEGRVIPGWDKGVVGMKVGGRRELIIPPALAYGAQAQQGIPANSTLVFIVDLLKVG